MVRTFPVFAASMVFASFLFGIAGCTSSPAPVAGNSPDHPTMSSVDYARYSDAKGHFHPEWVGQAGR